MERVSAAEVRAIVISHKIQRFAFHGCPVCNEAIYYRFNNDHVVIDNCCEDGPDDTRGSSYEGLALSFNRLDPQQRKSWWDKFLITRNTTRQRRVCHNDNQYVLV